MQNHSFSLLAALIALLLIASPLAAQVEFGVKAGVNLSQVKIESDQLDVDYKGSTDLQLGLLLNFPIGGILSIQPELNYIGRGYGENGIIIDNAGVDRKTNLGYLDVGGLVKLNFGQATRFYVGAGPFLGYALSGREDFGDRDGDIDFDSRDIKRTSTRAAVALGLSFGEGMKFFIDGRYLFPLSDLSADSAVEIKNTDIGITAGIMVPLGG